MEYWESKADDGLILYFDPCHPCKNRFHSANPSIPTFQYSIIPWYRFTAQPIFSDLAQRTRFSMLV
jgi:hypothetical protein